MVFHCYLDTAFGHVFAAFFGVAIAAASVLPLYGFGQFGSLLNARIFRWLGLYVLRHSADRRIDAVDTHSSAFPSYVTTWRHNAMETSTSSWTLVILQRCPADLATSVYPGTYRRQSTAIQRTPPLYRWPRSTCTRGGTLRMGHQQRGIFSLPAK
ncbi:hypothetical protein WJX75_004312 [Coccomyxa subellipsoidea]|uniref:Uncharacterized protein n=1 Tax=Coccomyxa subellipsoidea TaxID=248742 RepID=A0ABR2YTR3_9CHLO